MITQRQLLRTTILFPLLVSASLAADIAPTVTKTVPSDGAKDVKPGLSTIRIEFDRDMDTRSGYSVMRDAKRSFPKVEGAPQWESPRVFILKVRLDAKAEYGFGINSTNPAQQRFRSKEGVPVEPVAFHFATAAAAPPLTAAELAAANRKAVEELREAIDDRYSYRDLREVDWPKTFNEFREQLEGAESLPAFTSVAAKLLGRAKDVHIWLELDGKRIETTPWVAKANYHSAGIAATVPNFRKIAPSVAVGRFTDEVDYVVIGTFLAAHQNDIEAAAKHIAGLDESASLILDVRPNGGGDEILARQIAGLFLAETKTYAKNRSRDPDAPDGFGPVYDRQVGPRSDGLKFPGKKVVVLIGPQNGSSCEGFLLMMKQVPGCQLIGERTLGASGNPQPVALSNGVTVWLPSWQALFPDGTLLEARGIEPDIHVHSKGVDWTKSDPVIEKARELLKR